MEAVYVQIAIIESVLRIQIPTRLRTFWLTYPGGRSLSRQVAITGCTNTNDDQLDRIYGLCPVNEVLDEARISPWLLVQQVVPIGLFASSSILVWRIGDESAHLYMIDSYEQCSPYGPKPLYPVTGYELTLE